MDPSLLTVAQVARLTMVPRDCVLGLVGSGQLPSVPNPHGPGRVVRRADLEEFVKVHAMPALPPEGSPDRWEQLLAECPVEDRPLVEEMIRREWPET